MKRALLIIAILLTALFMSVATNYEMIGVISSDGFVFDNNKIQANIYADTVSENVLSTPVFAAEGIYKRINTVYYGDANKVKVNFSYPMYINHGEAIKLLSGNESLITEDFEFISGYSNLILNDGEAFNSTFERADFNKYILVHLSNYLYVNTKEIKVDTFLNSYTIPANSIVYFSKDRISYYTLKGDNTFFGYTISDIGDDTYITVGGVRILYADLLLNLGETVKYHQNEQRPKPVEEPEEEVVEEPTSKKDKKKKDKPNRPSRSDDSNDDDDNKIVDVDEEVEEEEEPQEEEDTEWLPKVTMGKNFDGGVYSLNMSVNIDDPNNAIYGGLVFEVFDQNAFTNKETTSKVYKNGTLTDSKTYSTTSPVTIVGSETIDDVVYYKSGSEAKGYEYFLASDIKLPIIKRSAFLMSSAEEEPVLLTGLKPETNYLVSAYYKCKDPDGRPYEYTDKNGNKHTQFDFLTPQAFSTKPVTDLGSIVFTEFDTSGLLSNQIQISNVGFTNDSDMDAVATLSRIQYKITKDGKVVDANILSSKQLASLIQLQKTSLTYRNGIESNSTYKIELTCFDMYGNELTVDNNSAIAKTCMVLPTSLIKIDYNKDEQGKEILGEINLSASFDNPDGVEYKNLKMVITNAKGETYKYYDEASEKYLDYIPCTPNQVYHLDGFALDNTYTVAVVCDCDNNDGKGLITREIATRDFTTAPLSLLGALNLNVSDISRNVCPKERHNRAVLEVSLSSATNEQLPAYVDFLSMTLTSDRGNASYTFTEEELKTLLEDNGKVLIDSDNLNPPGLVGITQYNIKFTAQHDFEDGSKYTINVNPSLKQFETVRTPVEILMSTPVTAPGYINTSVMINDADDTIVGDTAVLKIYEVSGNTLKLTASFVIDKNTEEYKQIILSSDSSLSTDGNSYDIKQDATYRFIFQADEANTENGAVRNYILAEKDVTIDTGVKGKIYLSSLEEFKYGTEIFGVLPEEYQQVEYIHVTGNQYIDTGVYPKETIGVDVTITSTDRASKERIFFGSGLATAYASGTTYALEISSANKPSARYDMTTYAGGTTAINQKQNIKFNLNGDRKLIVDGAVVDTAKAATNLPESYSMYLGDRNIANSVSTSYTFVGNIYECKIYDGTEMIRNFIPCFEKESNIYGFYDLVESKFYTNKGSGSFAREATTVDSTYSNKDENTSYLSTLTVDMSYPDEWLGNKSFYVDVKNDSNTSVDKLIFSFNNEKSTDTKYYFDVTSSLGNCLASSSVTLKYNSNSNSFKGQFRYIVDRHADKDKKYEFDLFTVLLDNLLLSNSKAELIAGTKEELPEDMFKQDLSVSIDVPEAGLDDYSFYIDIYNEEVSSDIVYDTLYFKYVSDGSSSDVLKFNVYRTSDINTLVQTVELNKQSSNSYSGLLNGLVLDNIDDETKKYKFSTYRKVQNDFLYVPLDSASFSTEATIYTIANIDEFFAVKTTNHKYVVIADLFYEDTTKHASTGGKWGSTSLNAQIDFQGFSLTYKGYNNLVYKMSETAEISNMVYKTTADLIKNTNLATQGSNNRGAGSFVSENYGKFKNIYIEYSEVQPEDIADEGSTVYRGPYYWSDDPNHADATGKKYSYLHTQSGLAINNYGTIENFVVDVKTPINTGYISGMIAADNFGTIRNGYVFSSTNEEYKAIANVYRNSSYSSNLKEYNKFGFISGSSKPSGVYVGIDENIYVLGDINNCTGTTDEALGLVCGYDSSIVRNTYTYGNVLTDGKVNGAYGPTIGYTTSSINRNPNNNYISTYSYNNNYNLPTSTIALRSKSWVADVLNANNYHEFNVDEMIAVNCYPHVNMSDIMPAQLLLELPPLPSKDEVDVLFSETYKFGQAGNEDIDAILNERRSENRLGDLIYGEKEGSPYTSDSQIVVVYVSDKSASQIHSLTMSDPTMVNNILLQTMNGTGISVCYFEVYNPSEALSKYHITGLYFKDYAGEKSYPPFSISRDMDVSYVKLITEVSEWKSVIENPNQNHRLGADLDFTGVSMKDIFVNSDFSGTLDGMDENGVSHTLKNIEYDSKAFSSIFSSTLSGSNSADIGLFKSISGKVKNVTLENVNFEGGENVGILAGTTNGAIIESVFVKNCYAAGTSRVGGIAASITYTDIFDSGVTDTKLISTGGKYNTANENFKNGIGGVAAYVQIENNIERVFTNNVYIESFTRTEEYSTAGGLIGYLNGSGNKINGCYATGTINSNAYASGGLVGMNYVAFEMNYCYADVDVNSYFYNAGGLVGIAYASITSETPLLSFGDVHSATILENDGRKDTFKLVGNNYRQFNNTTNTLSGMYYDKATLLSNGKLTPTGDSFDIAYFNSESISNNLGHYFQRDTSSSGVLPKLVDLEGNVLDNQPDNYISGFDGEIKVSINDSTSGKVVIDITHDYTITVNKIYTDYTYVNSLINVDNKNEFFGVKSLTNRIAMNYQLDKSSTSSGTRFTMSSMTPNASYDYYNITAIEYTKDGETHYLRVNHRLNNMDQSIRTISSLSDFNKYVAPSIAENFELTGDLDFGGSTVNYYDEKNTNLVINRLVGKKGTADNYLDIKESSTAKPYYEISNLNINGTTDVNQEHGYIYSYVSNLFKVVLSDISNITFKNIKINGKADTALIGILQGKAQNISFIDCDITNTNAVRNIALIGEVRGSLSNIYVDSCDINVKNYYSGILVGCIYANSFNENITNVYINKSNVSAAQYYCGALVGRIVDDYAMYKNPAVIDNVTVVGCEVYSGSNSVGGIIGRIDANTFFTLQNSKVTNSKIYSPNVYVGGVLGYNGSANNTVLYNIYSYKNTIYSTNTGNTYVGGIAGYNGGLAKETTVEDCLIYSKGSYVAGAFGYTGSDRPSVTNIGLNSYEDNQEQYLHAYVLNTKVYGNNYIGGFAANHGNSAWNAVVKNCEIKGNNYVGGIAATGAYTLSNSYIYNSTITPWKDSTESSPYGITYSSSQSYFGAVSGYSSRMIGVLAENCFVGGENANYVGSVSGLANFTGLNTQVIANTSTKNCIVVGNNYVGGLFGMIKPTTETSGKNLTNLYSNAYVYGSDNVGGIAGKVSGFVKTVNNVTTYVNMPFVENIYFTGALTSKANAGAIYGSVDGNTTAYGSYDMFRNLSSFPKYIKAKKISPYFCDGSDWFSYNFTNLISDTSNIELSLWKDTQLYLYDDEGFVEEQTTMNNYFARPDLFKKYYANPSVDDYSVYVTTPETAFANYALNKAGDPFTTLYESTDSIKENFCSYSLSDVISENKMNATYKYAEFRNTFSYDYMPMTYYNVTKVANEVESNLIFFKYDGSKLIGNRYHSIANPFESNRIDSVRAQQGVAIPDTSSSSKFALEGEYMTNIYNLYVTGGIYATGLGVGSQTGINEGSKYFEPVYKNLPEEYQQVEYIHMTGNQYIDTGVYPKATIGVDVTLTATDKASKERIFFGSGLATAYASGTTYALEISSANKPAARYDMTTYTGGATALNQKQNIKFNLNGDRKLVVDGAVVSTANIANNLPTSYSMYLGDRNIANKVSSGYVFVGDIYDCKMYDGTEMIRNFIPCYKKETNVYGFYDLVEDKFYPNNGKGAFTGGQEILESQDFARALFVYPSSSSTINLEMESSFVSLLKEMGTNAYLSIYDGTDHKLVDSYEITPSTKVVSINYDFSNLNKMVVQVNKDSYTLNLPLSDITSVVRNVVSISDEHVYYLADYKLYTENGLYDESHNYVHLYHDEVIDSEGNVYALSDLSKLRSVTVISVLSTPVSLYTLDYSGKYAETFGGYSVIDSKLSDTYRVFKSSGNLIALDSNSNPVADPLYAKYIDGNSTILMLKKDNKVYSIGTNSILNKLQSFTNENIVAITTNLHNKVNSANNYVGFAYSDGSVVIYDVVTGNRVDATVALTSNSGSKDDSLFSFLSKKLSLNNMFSFSSSNEELSGEKNRAEKVANLLTSSGLSLNDVVEYASENGDNMISIVNAANNSKPSMITIEIEDNPSEEVVDDNTSSSVVEEEIKPDDIIDNLDEDNTESGIDIVINDNTDQKEQENQKPEEFPTPDDVTDETNTDSHLITDVSESKKEEFITVYNGETNEFEILDVNELLENPEEVESENMKVVDRSTLRALYNALGEAKDDTTRNGIVIYSVIAGAIILLLLPIEFLKRNLGKKH